MHEAHPEVARLDLQIGPPLYLKAPSKLSYP
jgi:hypothetical protein